MFCDIYSVVAGVEETTGEILSRLVWPGLVLMIAALKMVRRNGRLDQDNQFVCINSLFSWDFFHYQAAGR